MGGRPLPSMTCPQVFAEYSGKMGHDLLDIGGVPSMEFSNTFGPQPPRGPWVDALFEMWQTEDAAETNLSVLLKF